MDSKTVALSEFLKVNPAVIENNYSDYFTINERVIKEGKTPEQYQEAADNFKLLLDEDMTLLVTKTIEAKDVLSSADIDVVYQTVKATLAPLAEKALKAKERHNRSGQDWRPVGGKDVIAYLKLRDDNIHVGDVLYHLLSFDDTWNKDHCEQLQNAWLGKPVSDIRKDRTINDGEYLVLTDDEADKWERDGLEQLFEEMTHEVPEYLKRFMDVDAYVEEYSGARGENISGYDGEENEQEHDGVTYYIYRNN